MPGVKISDLEASTNPPNTTDEMPIVQGGTTKRLTLGALVTQLESFTQSGTGAVAGTVQTELRYIVRPEQFGAVGDGVTNDTAAFSSAIAKLVTATRGTLELDGTKTYLLNGGTASADGYKNGILIPFLQVNFDETKTITIQGNGAVLKCGSNSMVLLRISRNNVTVKDLSLDYNSKSTVILCGIVPEDMTQTTTQVSQSMVTLENVTRTGGIGVEGIIIQPGPKVGGSDSGCFYHNIIGGVSNFVGGGRHIFQKKNADWATNPNKPTRTNYIGQRLIRGNVGYYFDVGSEINLIGCNEELVASDTTPLATPTARYVTNNCANIRFFGGYTESSSASFEGPTTTVVSSYGYVPGSGGTVTFKAYVSSYDDGISPITLTVTLASSGGGAQGASSSGGLAWKAGKLVTFEIEVNVAKGTLAAGNLSVTGLPWSVSTSGPGLGGISVSQNGAITLAANYASIGGYITGSTITLRKSSVTGFSQTNLTLAECSDPVQLVISGSYVAA